MKLKDIKKIGVIGAGTMGRGIAQVFAEAEFEIYLFDKNIEIAKKAKEKITESLNRKIEKEKNKRSVMGGKLAKTIIHSGDVLDKIHPDVFNSTRSKCEFHELDFIIEAVYENPEIKKEIFTALNTCCKTNIILATNTSSIKIKDITSVIFSRRKPKFIGMHFMNPPHAVKLLEIIRSKHTSEETYALVCGLAKKLNRDPIITSEDVPGFLCNRILMQPILEALRCLEDKTGDIDSINNSTLAGIGGAMGPLSLGDLIGWDIVLAITKVLQKEFGARYDSPKILIDLVEKDYLGRKRKRGVFDFVKGDSDDR